MKNEKKIIRKFYEIKTKLKGLGTPVLQDLDLLVDEYEAAVASNRAFLSIINELSKTKGIPFKELYESYVEIYNKERARIHKECFYPFECDRRESSREIFSVIDGGK